jgi:hypothetical protein
MPERGDIRIVNGYVERWNGSRWERITEPWPLDVLAHAPGTRRATKRAPAKRKATAKRAPAKRKATAKRAPAKRKATAKRAPAKRKATAKRAPAKRKSR